MTKLANKLSYLGVRGATRRPCWWGRYRGCRSACPVTSAGFLQTSSKRPGNGHGCAENGWSGGGSGLDLVRFAPLGMLECGSEAIDRRQRFAPGLFRFGDRRLAVEKPGEVLVFRPSLPDDPGPDDEADSEVRGERKW